MENTQSYRSFMAEKTPFSPPINGLPRRQNQQPTSLLNPSQQTPNPTLESYFSRLNVNCCYPDSFADDFSGSSIHEDPINDSKFYVDGFSSLFLQQMEQDSSSLNLQNSDRRSFGFRGLNSFSQPISGQNGFFRDFGNGEINNGLPRNMFLYGMVPRNQSVSSSSLNIQRRQWLEEPFDCLSLGDLRGKIVAMAKDQYGCRCLQRTMNGITKEEIDMIFLELIDHVCELMIDPFGNYVLQKLVEICSEEQRTQILLVLTRNDFQLVRISLNMHGTRAVQKLLQHITTQQQISLVTAALSAGLVALTKDMNGHHVIQHCLKHFSDEDNKDVLNEVADNCYGVATDKSGCCVLQYCVEYSKGAQRERLVAEIIADALLLAEDRYGNYVVQHILGLREPKITADLLRQLEGHYTPLSCNKYGSNVVEKCLVESGERQSMRIVMELLRNPNVSLLLTDPFGNYVIQSALLVSKGFVHSALRNLVSRNAPMMRSNIYGNKVLAWFERRKLIHL